MKKDKDGIIRIKAKALTSKELERFKQYPLEFMPYLKDLQTTKDNFSYLNSINKNSDFINEAITPIKQLVSSIEKIKSLGQHTLITLDTYKSLPNTTNFNKLNQAFSELEQEKKKADNNNWYHIVVTDYNKKIQALEDKSKNKDEEIKHLKEFIIAQQNLNNFYNTLEAEVKTTEPPKPNKLTLLSQLTPTEITILHNKTKHLFNASLEQWQGLFSQPIEIQDPIVLKPDTTISMLCYLFNELREQESIQKNQYYKILELAQAFSKENKIVNSKQLIDAKTRINKGYIKGYEIIDFVIETLKKG